MKIPYYPSRESRLKRLLEIFEPEPGTKIVDLGSGDGRVLRMMANRFEDILLHGYETDRRLVEISRKLSEDYSNIMIINSNLFDVDLTNYDIVYTYLTSDALKSLSYKAFKFIEKGGVWIALDYAIPGLEPIFVLELDKWHRFFIYSSNKRRIRRMFKI